MRSAEASVRPAIVVTRARQRLDRVERLAARHGLVLRWRPVLETQAAHDAIDAIEAAGRLRRRLAGAAFDWVAVTSARAIPALVEAWSHAVASTRVTRRPRIAAVGPATARRLRAFGLRVALVGPGPGGAALARAMLHVIGPAPARVLWPRSTRPNREFAADLRRAGVRVIEVASYSTAAPGRAAVHSLRSALVSGRVAALCVTAPSIARLALRRLPASARATLQGVTVASFGPLTTTELRRAGIEPHLERADGDLETLLRALIRAAAARTNGRAA